MSEKTRFEEDSLGKLPVHEGAYYGIQTLRAAQNFPISGLKAAPELVEAVVQIKKAAARVNSELGRLEKDKAQAIIKACDEILAGRLRDQFLVDVFQMGAGTSFHMNCNEVIANRAEEMMGGKKGEYRLIHPIDQVNMGQSTNDVYPTAMRLALLSRLRDLFYPASKAIEEAFTAKGKEFDNILKSGRTHLQDAAPIRLGQEFTAYGRALSKARGFLEKAALSLLELGIGGSAVGTGLNTSPEYSDLMAKCLSEQTKFDLVKSEDLREAMQSMRPLAEVSAALRNIALEMNRIANDLRLLSSGPKTGLAEIILPPVAPGSSAMPGKVNPSMLEMMNMVCFQVIGCDLAVSTAVQAGQLELNVMMPVIAFNLSFMIQILGNSFREVKTRCIDGIQADDERCRRYAESSLGLVTALSPYIGYSKAAEVAIEALKTGKSLTEVVEERGLLNKERLREILDPAKMTEPGTPTLKKKR
ncbi:MAG: aspartate ammonia-lyase [Candidatus Aminicenantes bacterium]|nr:aspartate ammonia-lyase [Candidatus Aminicenantes bacterium]